MPQFERYLGIDYSGAQTPVNNLPGLQVYEATLKRLPFEIKPTQSVAGPLKKKHWSRKGIAEFLARELQEGPCTLVGIDHGFSFSLSYFNQHSLPHDWHKFLDDFQQHWPTDLDHMKVDFIRLIPVFNQCQRAINIINLDLPNDRTGFLQFVVVKKRDFYTIEKTPNKSGVIANCRHQLFKNGRIIIAIGI